MYTHSKQRELRNGQEKNKSSISSAPCRAGRSHRQKGPTQGTVRTTTKKGIFKMKLGPNEIALAMELRTEGVQWKVIANGLSVNVEWLQRKTRAAKKQGLELWK